MRTHSKWNHASQASHWIISSVTNNRIQTHSCCTHRFRTNVHSLRVHSCASMLNNICSESSVTACMTCFRSLSFPLYWRIPSTNRKFFALLRSIYSFLSPCCTLWVASFSQVLVHILICSLLGCFLVFFGVFLLPLRPSDAESTSSMMLCTVLGNRFIYSASLLNLTSLGNTAHYIRVVSFRTCLGVKRL